VADPREFRELVRGAYIYLLRESEREEYRYVGQTSGPQRRINGHKARARAYLRELRRRSVPAINERQRELDLRLPDSSDHPRVRPPRYPTDLVEWLASTITPDDRVQMRVVERVACSRCCNCWPGGFCQRAARRETFWIDYLQNAGHRLFNRQRPYARRP
jgi:hypothetical protein